MPEVRPSTAIAAVIVLAAGSGTRMRSALPKVLHPIGGKPLLWHALAAAAALRPVDLVAVIGHGREQVSGYLTEQHAQVRQAVQQEQLGTGHAVACALAGSPGLTGTVLVTYGDVPLLTPDTLTSLVAEHQRADNAVTVLTAVVGDPTGYGRIVRDRSGALTAIVEQRDADDDQREIREINSGVYAFDAVVLADALGRLTPANTQGERYLTDVVAMARADGHPVGTLIAADAAETEGINDRVQLAELSRQLNARLIRRAQLAGVTVDDPATTWLHVDVQIGPDTRLLPGTSVEDGTVIGPGCLIGPDTTLSACDVAPGATVIRSHCIGASIGPAATVGPFSFLRHAAVLGESAKVGAFVEVKNSTLGRKTKVPHLSYVGDATIGSGTNLGAGSITANYDGIDKHPTVIGRDVFIGSDSTLIAPVTVGDGAYVAAGSTVTESVEPGDLAVARGHQRAVKGWVLRRRAGTRSDRSARSAGACDRPSAPAPPSGPTSPVTGTTAAPAALPVTEEDLPA